MPHTIKVSFHKIDYVFTDNSFFVRKLKSIVNFMKVKVSRLVIDIVMKGYW